MNLYGYALGDPINFRDPLGLHPLALAIRALASAGPILVTGVATAGKHLEAGAHAIGDAIDAVGEYVVENTLEFARFARGKLRERVLEEGQGVCSYCCTPSDQMQIDHIDPWACGGPTEEDNLTAACPGCNASKGKKTIVHWLLDKIGFDH